MADSTNSVDAQDVVGNQVDTLIPFDELQKAIDMFDRVEVTYYDGKPISSNIEQNGVAVLRVAGVSPTHRADGKNILHVRTTHWAFKGAVSTPLTTHSNVSYSQSEVDDLLAEARREKEIEVLDKVIKYNNATNKENNSQLLSRLTELTDLVATNKEPI